MRVYIYIYILLCVSVYDYKYSIYLDTVYFLFIGIKYLRWYPFVTVCSIWNEFEVFTMQSTPSLPGTYRSGWNHWSLPGGLRRYRSFPWRKAWALGTEQTNAWTHFCKKRLFSSSVPLSKYHWKIDKAKHVPMRAIARGVLCVSLYFWFNLMIRSFARQRSATRKQVFENTWKHWISHLCFVVCPLTVIV